MRLVFVFIGGPRAIRTPRVHSDYQCLRGFQPCKSLHFEAFLNKTLLQNLTPCVQLIGTN